MSWFNDGMSVLERDEQLAALRQAMDTAATSGGEGSGSPVSRPSS